MWPFTRRTERKENPVGSQISAWYVGQPVWTPRRYDQLSEEGYIRNAVAFRCIKMIATNAATVPWLLEDAKSGKPIDKHDLLNLLNRPAPMIGGHALFEAFYAYLLISGNTYLTAPMVAGGARPPVELWNLRPDRMRVIPGPFGVAQGYEYVANGSTKRFAVDPLTGMGEVLHVKEFHPNDDWYGLGRVEAAAYGIDRHNAAAAHNKALLDNGARPSGALVFQPIKGPNNSEQPAPQLVIDEAKKELEENRVGPKNAGKPLVYGGNVNWLEMGITPKDMDFAAGKLDAARDICYAFGVPDVLIVPGQSTYNNIAEAKVDLWENTIIPLIDLSVDSLSAWLCPQFGDNLRLGVDLDEISALEPRRTAKRTSIVTLYDKGLLDDTEAREALQYGPRPAGAIKLQRGDGQTITALVTAAQADTGMLEPLYRYLVSTGLLDPGSTSLEQFIAGWNGAAPPLSVSDALNALVDAKPDAQDTVIAE
jgi:HK97 family phage portal protein